MAPDEPTLIVGGGIAGLMCARTLARSGRRVLLLEKEDEVGGRVRTSARDGFLIDHGFQVLFSAYPVLSAALDLPALQLREFAPAARIARGSGEPALIGDPLADLALLWPSLVATPLSLMDKWRLLRLRSLATSLSFDDCFAPRFDKVSTRDFLWMRGFGASAISNFFAPFYGGILLDRSLESSASILLYTFKMLAEGRTTVPAHGMGAIAEHLMASLPPLSVRTGAAVTRIHRDDDGRVRGVTLVSGEELLASAVVLACDPLSIASLATTAHVHVSVPTASLGCTTIYLRSNTPLLSGEALWLNAAANATVSHAITISNVAPTYAPTGSSLTAATMLGAAAVLDDTELIPRVRSDLALMGRNKECANAELLAVWRVPYAQYAQPPGTVGRRVAAMTSTPGLYLASEIGHTSSLEGAARGGTAAAQAVMRDTT
jgi:phytoene dehydrogenase-like protein